MSSYISRNPSWICFISGLEVPIITASTSAMAGQLATAQITMPYSPFLSKLPKHTKIILFSYDPSVDSLPKFEFDGVIQGISWRKDKGSGNTALFVMAQTDGIIWSARKKFNFYLDNAFGMDRALAQSQDSETIGMVAQNAIFDSISQTIKTADGDGGKAAAIFLTHTFNTKGTIENSDLKLDGTLNYRDCGSSVTTKQNSLGSRSETVNENYYGKYIKKYYQSYNVLNKVCRLPLPDLYMEAFQFKLSFSIIMNTLQSLQGEVNFWNFATYICDQFAFEVFDIPDATYVGSFSSIDAKYVNRKSTDQQPFLAEYLIKPKAPFGPIPLCNIVFPDQVLDKSYYRNFQAEITRVSSAQMMLPVGSRNVSALSFNFYQGPHFEKQTDNDYFASFDVSKLDRNPRPNAFLKRSDYEEEFGVNSKLIELPELASRMYATKRDWKPIQNMVNQEYLVAYTDKVTFSMQVTPDVEIVPGLSVLVLDENGEHLIAYCYGREKLWDKNGQVLINLKLAYPRPYDLNTASISNIANPFDEIEFPTSSKKDLAILAQYIGCKFLATDNRSMISDIHGLMENWIETYKQDTTLTKNSINAWRTMATYNDYLAFHQASPKPYDTSNPYNKMPEQLINKWDISVEACTMAALQYTYAENGYKDPQSTASKPGFKPVYDDLNTPGPIEVSTYIQGIVNCHNRYLMQVGNSIT